MIETVLGCNLRCPECAIGGDIITRKKEMMSFDNFKIIADKISPYAQYVYLHIWGEPMLNDNIIEMIKYTGRFAKTNISTNANCLTPQLAEDLIKSRVSDLIISIDGTTEEIYKQYRVGGDFQKSMYYLDLLQKYNKQYGNKVNIIPQFCVFKHNEHQIDEFREICNSMQLTAYFRPVYIRKYSSLKHSSYKDYQKTIYNNRETVERKIKNCDAFRSTFIILVDGTVTICCYDHDGNISFGNIRQQSLEEIWQGKMYNNFRKRARQGNLPSFCLRNCLCNVYEPTADTIS